MTAKSVRSESGAVASDGSSLLAAVRVLRERWWVILVSAVVCTGVALVIAARQPKQYRATTTLLIQTSNLASLIDPTQAQTSDAATQQGNNLSLVQSSAVALLVKKSLHLSDSVTDLQSKVDATAVPNTNLLSVSITDESPTRAAALANAFANSLVTYLSATDRAKVAAGQAAITAQIAHLAPQDNQSRSVLEQALSRVVALRAVTNGDIQVVDPAVVPTSASSPQPKRNAAAGALVGIVLGLAFAFLLDIFDRRVKSAEELEELYRLPLLASIPNRRRRELDQDLEPFRILRDALTFLSDRNEARVILVTSAISGEGKTRVSSGLAQAIAVAGRRVALIEADLHRPALLRDFGVKVEARGLTNALIERVDPLSVMLQTHELPTLAILPSGPLTPNSAELLRSSAMSSVISDLTEAYEFVVLDAPPLLPVADAQVLLANPLIDSVVMVARPYLTTRQHVRSATAVLRRHPQRNIGLVLNGVHDPGATGYAYSDAPRARAKRSDRSNVHVRQPEPKHEPTPPPDLVANRVGHMVGTDPEGERDRD